MKFKLFNRVTIQINKYKKNIDENKIWYRSDLNEFKSLSENNNDFILLDNYPCLNDKNQKSGTINGMYFHQDLYVAKEIYKRKPIKHVDIGSSVEGFVAHVASFREIEIFDIRKLHSNIENIIFKQIDFMSTNNYPLSYCDSISSLNVIEHFGLGRYGDSIDPNGHLNGFNNISKMLKKDGIFYFSVPMGKEQKIEFNAHRIFNLQYLIDWVRNLYHIDNFCYIDDMGDLCENTQLTDDNIKYSFNCNFGCAIFILRKK